MKNSPEHVGRAPRLQRLCVALRSGIFTHQAVAYHFEDSTKDVGPVAFARGDRVVFHASVPRGIVTQFGVDEEPLIVLEYVESAATTFVCRDRYSFSMAEFLVEDGREYGYAEVVAFSPATNQVLTAPKHLFRRVP